MIEPLSQTVFFILGDKDMYIQEGLPMNSLSMHCAHCGLYVGDWSIDEVNHVLETGEKPICLECEALQCPYCRSVASNLAGAFYLEEWGVCSVCHSEYRTGCTERDRAVRRAVDAAIREKWDWARQVGLDDPSEAFIARDSSRSKRPRLVFV